MTDSDAKFYSGKLIIATGGLSYPRTGSTGDGYLFAESLGHCVTKRLPSLTALLPENYDRSLEGISLKNISLTLTINGNTASSEFGDMDFTDGGIEGPLGFKLSRKAVSALSDGQKVDIILDLKPAVSDEKLSARILRELKGMGISTVDFTPDVTRKLLARLMPLALIRPFLKANGNLSSENIVSSLKNWKMHIVSNVGYERCVVTAGGVSLKEISRKTMESKFSPGLYFAGEVMDLDGDTGGYNLQIAFSTGALAAKSAVSSLAKEQ
jgi:predicted Rossmann fold flavoprotein